ncbi:MAG: peptidoglycan bridge formation glycyltransferase FemA/FemB family protein [Patescibacteria group bacterium]
MEIREVTSKEEWEGFLQNCVEKTFLQSWSWGDFNVAMGSKIWRYGVFYNNNLAGVALIIKVSARRGTFLFVPHGPVIKENLEFAEKKEIMQSFLELLKQLAQEEKALGHSPLGRNPTGEPTGEPSFIRISPILEDNEKNQNIFSELGFRSSPIHASAYEATWKLDVYQPEEELLQNMRKTTRYLIKKAGESSDIFIEKTADLNKLEIYQKLNKKVSQRQKFVPFSEKFVKNEFEIFAKENQSLLFFGKYKGEVTAGAMVIFWSGTAFYHQAASTGMFTKYSIPYLLQWEAIKEAKARGCAVYDFWGFTDPEKFPHHPWAGPTLFKIGFGGYKKEYIKTQDYIISQKYWINYIIEKTRKFIRGL